MQNQDEAAHWTQYAEAARDAEPVRAVIDRGSTHVWKFALETEGRAAEQVAQWKSVLSPEEVIRSNAFRGEEHRRDYIAAHAALRFVLAQRLGIGPRSVSLAPNESVHGGASRSKPALSKEMFQGRVGSGLDLRFNMSHTRGAGMIAAANGFEIGVDVEWHRPLDDLDGMAETVMSEDEFKVWKAIRASPDRDLGAAKRAFYHLWTRKESYLKAIGLGLYRDLKDVTVPVSAERLRFVSGSEYEAIAVKDVSGSGSWRLIDLPVDEEYSASLCFEASDGMALPDSPKVVIAEFDLDLI